MKMIEIKTEFPEEIVDVTQNVENIVAVSGVKEGLCVVFVPHTTAGLTINENADPDVKADILTALAGAVPAGLPFRHSEGNSPAHIKASLMGSSATVIIEGGRLKLGTWQGLQFCEFDGPRSRRIWVRVIGDK
jgi:secondary thiamine-phosphate synthase enzyme